MYKTRLLFCGLLLWLVACTNQPEPTPLTPTTPTDATGVQATIAPIVSTASPAPTATPEHVVQLHYNIDRSALPPLTYNDVTLLIDIGDFPDYVVTTVNGEMFRDRYDENAGILTLTTHAPQFIITLPEEAIANPNLGDHTIATLFDNKKWAWSHGFDDNVNLLPAIQAFQKYGYTATLYLIANIVDDTRQEDWIVDAPLAHDLMTQGWSMGNHTLDHACFAGGDAQTVLDGQTRLNEIIANSPLPYYQIISFAAPCFDADYNPTFFQIRDSGQTSLQFIESGDNHLHVIDPTQNDPISLGERTLYPFTPQSIIGRDTRIETDGEAVLAEFDWIANNVSDGQHIWYNTLAHGEHEATIEELLAYIDKTYGFNGTNDVWIAPSDRIYSYLIVRNSVEVTLEIEE